MDHRVPLLFLSLCSFGILAENTSQAETYEYRLVGGARGCEGGLDVKIPEEGWTPVAGNDFNLKMAQTVCAQLNCGSALHLSKMAGSKRQMWASRTDCEDSEEQKCFDVLYFISSRLGISCSESVRLVQGPSLCSGSLQLHSDQSWTSVCEEDFDLQDAEVLCRELGCGAPSLLQGALYGEGQAPWGQTFQCEGHESALMDCSRSNSTGTSCSSGKAVQLTCSEPVRLVGQPSRCAGTVAVKHLGEWRPVTDDEYDQWDRNTTDAVCQQLGCGSAVSEERRNDLSYGLVWSVSPLCMRSTYALRECVEMGINIQSSGGVDIVCSDLLFQPNISLSVSADGVSEAQPQGLQVLLGSDFSVRCSIKPQYPGGFFQLISATVDPAQNHTLPAVNHSAHFLFSDAGRTHRGGYTCVYHLHVYSHNFSSQSHTLYLSRRVIADSNHHLLLLLIPVGLLILLALLVLIISTKIKSNKAQRSTRNSGNNTEIALYENVGQGQVPEDPAYQTLCPATMDPVYCVLGPQQEDSV